MTLYGICLSLRGSLKRAWLVCAFIGLQEKNRQWEWCSLWNDVPCMPAILQIPGGIWLWGLGRWNSQSNVVWRMESSQYPTASGPVLVSHTFLWLGQSVVHSKSLLRGKDSPKGQPISPAVHLAGKCFLDYCCCLVAKLCLTPLWPHGL